MSLITDDSPPTNLLTGRTIVFVGGLFLWNVASDDNVSYVVTTTEF
jgi:hypothetical protein